jgi:hypothetical protein
MISRTEAVDIAIANIVTLSMEPSVTVKDSRRSENQQDLGRAHTPLKMEMQAMDIIHCRSFTAREAEFSKELPGLQAHNFIQVALDQLTTKYQLSLAAPRPISIIIFDFLQASNKTHIIITCQIPP